MALLFKQIVSASRPAMAGLAIAAIFAGTTCVAQAHDDAGVVGFFQQAFGGGEARDVPAPQPEARSVSLPQPDYAQPSSRSYYAEPSGRPLTVRRRPTRHERPTTTARAPRAVRTARVSRSPKDTLEALKGVTIYTDKTLAPGDAVMTTAGMRIFNGSHSWPYRNEDFVALSSSSKVAPDLRKELYAMDVASRVELTQ